MKLARPVATRSEEKVTVSFGLARGLSFMAESSLK